MLIITFLKIKKVRHILFQHFTQEGFRDLVCQFLDVNICEKTILILNLISEYSFLWESVYRTVPKNFFFVFNQIAYRTPFYVKKARSFQTDPISIRYGSRLKFKTENAFVLGILRFVFFTKKTKIIDAYNGRDRAFEK